MGRKEQFPLEFVRDYLVVGVDKKSVLSPERKEKRKKEKEK